VELPWQEVLGTTTTLPRIRATQNHKSNSGKGNVDQASVPGSAMEGLQWLGRARLLVIEE
jgi:hypothetical protein